jgi:hypothetical protein
MIRQSVKRVLHGLNVSLLANLLAASPFHTWKESWQHPCLYTLLFIHKENDMEAKHVKLNKLLNVNSKDSTFQVII